MLRLLLHIVLPLAAFALLIWGIAAWMHTTPMESTASAIFHIDRGREELARVRRVHGTDRALWPANYRSWYDSFRAYEDELLRRHPEIRESDLVPDPEGRR